MGYLKRNNVFSLVNVRVYDMIVISREMRSVEGKKNKKSHNTNAS
ncbi:hypothetical protein C5167_013371 [Papaver somniferum]|uniref:Uncharacterized protein n=1 Tax=Papaver somniferum TaxID=3469 RepID=A0A4Y7J057_PAPSO|nr:hypothetical protein C5167_013371 [Papaver somniferum]